MEATSFFLYYGLLPLALVIAVGLMLFKITKGGKVSKNLVWPAIMVWLCGVAIYAIGLYHEGTKLSSFALLFRSAMLSMEMFVSSNELFEVRPEMKDDALYMTLFILVHFLAIFLTMFAALSLLGGKMSHAVRRWWHSKFNDGRPIFIFFGVNETSIITAKKIYESASSLKPRIFFIEFPQESGEQINFESLIGLSSLRHGLTEKLKEIGPDILLCYGNTPISEITAIDPRKKTDRDMIDRFTEKDFFSTFDKIGVGSLKNYIRKSGKDVKIFFLSDNKAENMRSFEALCSDPYILKAEKNKRLEGREGRFPKLVIYCHARYNNQNIICENRFLDTEKIEVHIMDKSHLSVHYLKSSLRHNPVSFVERKDGRVTSEFRSLVIGFGETGQDMMDFLYEFGSFVGEDGKRSPFHCHAIDSRMESIRSEYLTFRPEMARHSDMLEFSSLSYDSEEFWQMLRREIARLNYIVISIGNDEEGIALAIRIFKLARKERAGNFHNFKIFIREYSYESEKRMNTIANYYNNSIKDDQTHLYPHFIDTHVENEEGSDGTIVIFGELDEIFNLRYVYNDDERQDAADTGSTLLNAKLFYDRYAIATGDRPGAWDRRRMSLISSKESKERLTSLQSLKRKESQDLANSLHIDTKMWLMGLIPDRPLCTKEEKDALLERYSRYIRTAEILAKDGKAEDEEAAGIVTALAMTEHIRWMSAHEIMGYEPKDDMGCDEVTMRHGCLKDWDDIPMYQKYDYAVISTSLLIKMDELIAVSVNGE